MSLPALHIGELTARIPIIQGGMGIGISLSGLAGAVAKEGGIGVISAAQPGFDEPDFRTNTIAANCRALARHLKKARETAPDGIIGVNIMTKGYNYEVYAKCAVENGADIIFSGAGLPADLPACVEGSKTKIAPIIGSPKACRVLLKLWDRHHHTTADLVVIEGPKAGGHLGYTREEVKLHENDGYEKEILEILAVVHEFEEKYNKKIPVVFGGGVFDKEDIRHYLSLGLSGVQMATRFVATEECDAPMSFKQAYVNAKKDDIVICDYESSTNEKKIIKRVIGVGGDTIDFVWTDHKYYTLELNGENVDEPYINEDMYHLGDISLPYKVGEGEYFVMGDNRNESNDSRYAQVGAIKKKNITGKVFMSLKPFRIIK